MDRVIPPGAPVQEKGNILNSNISLEGRRVIAGHAMGTL